MASSVQSLLLDLADPDVGNEMVLEPGDDIRIKHVPPTLGAVRKLFESDPDGAVRAAASSLSAGTSNTPRSASTRTSRCIARRRPTERS